MSSDSTSDSGSDVVLIDRDDISDYNPDHILPVSANDIVGIRGWLQPTAYDDRFGEYQKHLASHAAGTGIWLTSSTTYREWLRSRQLGTLWVKGIPGSGKSVIAAQLIDDLAAQHPGTPILYFFFRQIIDANHDPIARRPLDTLSMDDLWRDLRLALGGLPNTAYCVVDALDEMDQGHDEFLRTLAGLGLWKPEKVKLLMTSRPTARLEAVLRRVEMLQIRLDETAVDKDISIFVQRKLSSTSITDLDRKLVLDAVPGRANGLFLYARLAMDAFLKPGANIRDVLAALPQDLNDMYTDLLEVHSLRSGIPPDLQRLILQCATHASRPLRLLEVSEMLERTYLSQTERNLKATKEMVRSACGPLLEILLDETVCVVHHSFTEYLKDTNRLDTNEAYPPLKPGPTHNTLALACLSYLEYALNNVKSQFQGFEESPEPRRLPISIHANKTSHQTVELRLKYPFLEYAASNWHVHATKSMLAGYDQEEVNKTLQRLFDDDARLNAWLHLAWPWGTRGLGNFTQLHVAAGLGLDHYVQELLKMGSTDVNSQDKLGRTPLWWAASSGHAGAVRLLAQAGANPDQDDNYDGYKPLHKASSANHADAVKTLIECGVSPMTGKTREAPGRRCGNTPSSVGNTPLMYACQYGHLESVDIFMSFISDPDVVHRALYWATSRGKSAVIRRILQHPKADIKAEERGSRLLALACSSGSADSVSVLLEAGADPNIYQIPHSDYGHSPLRKLCTTRQRSKSDENSVQDIFSLLMNAGVNVHERDKDGANALHWASGSPILTRLLIDAGADVNTTSFDGATPLHKAQNGEVMHLLVSLGGANINQRDKEGKTPLLACLKGSSYNREHLDRLLEFRPDCSVVDNKGNNIIHYLLRCYSSRDMTETLRGLLALGADPNCRNSSGDMPLHGISRRLGAVEQILDLLLAAGADLNAKDKQGSTVLFRAIGDQWPGALNFVELLIKKGASLAARDFQGRTLLHEAVKRRPPRPFYGRDRRADFFEFFLARGFDSSVTDHHGNNLLHELAMRSRDYDRDLWKKLLALGLDLSQRNYAGRTPLHIICSAKSTLDCIDFVISEMKNAGASSVDVVDNAGITPLHLASTVSGSYVQKLLDAGADPTRATYEGRTPLHLAAQSRAGNIVGVLLDALCRRQMEEKLSIGDTCDNTAPSVPRGSWYRDKEFQFLPEIINAQEISRTPNNRESGWTPLHYACRSGRPEIVALLLQAGADVDANSIFKACAEFEEEQSLWDTHHERGDDLDAGGLLLTDTSRPSTSARKISDAQQLPKMHAQTARIDDILEMVFQKIMQLKPEGELMTTWQNYLINVAFQKRKDYTVGCLATIQNQYERAKGQQTSAYSYAFHQSRYVQEATRHSLAEYKEIRNREGSEHTFQSLMLRRDYGGVRELARAGADFFQQESPYRNNNFRTLADLGFASLAKGIIDDLYPRSEDSAKEETQQASACSSQLSMTRTKSDCFENSSYLLTAVQQELPNMEMVRFLVEDCGVDINGGTGEEAVGSPLLSVARGEQWWHAALAVPYFIERSAKLNVRNHHGQTPLHIALGANQSQDRGFFRGDVVQALIKAGADINAVDAEGRSCLAYAGGNAQFSRLLLENGAKADSHTLLAVIKGNDYETLRMLLLTGVNPNIRLPKVKSILKCQSRTADEQLFAVHYAAKMCDVERYNTPSEEQAFLRIRKNMVETLLEYGADPFATCLQRSIVSENVKGPEDSNATVSESNDSPLPKGYVRSTILHDLIEESRLVEPFLRITNLDVDFRDSKGKTLLLSACSSVMGPDASVEIASSSVEDTSIANQSILRYLLSKGADPFARDNQDRNALHQMSSGVAQYSYFKNYSRHNSLLYMANKYPTLMKQKDKLGNTPLHLALRVAGERPKLTEAVMLLLQAGADPLVVDGEGNSGLHIIASRLHMAELRQLFRDLLSRGCDINGRNIRGETPIFAYYYLCHPDPRYTKPTYEIEVNAIWEDSGADFSVRDNTGRGLLHVAARGNARRFQELMDKGLDPKMDDENKQTPLDVAAACGRKDVLALFAKEKE
ncbi:hypothetical protein EKO27_g5912 [Xylaria grammica]|uniref:Nephrocystin 3-like N-terminal domain-containing protein n=1 Tax=Xylaria grammica TaxID=363999 RepID=A0A439D483_9PEZI|nr:hypothetical protein EKO27_g5912 [Xylaria grammica]